MTQRATANIGEMMEAQHDISVLKAMLKDAQIAADKWTIKFNAEIYDFTGSHNWGVKVTASAGGVVVQEIISPSLVSYFADDIDTLTHQLTTKIIETLLIDIAKDGLKKALSPAIKNAVQLSKSTL